MTSCARIITIDAQTQKLIIMKTQLLYSGLQITLIQDILSWLIDNSLLGTPTLVILIQEYPHNISSMRWGANILF